MASGDNKKIRVKFLVDKEKSRVVYAEADKDFVDILFSFLTLPLGTIIRVLREELSLGCINNLYESVKKLDIHHLQTEACKAMLLHPRSEAALMCEDLKVNVDDTKPEDVYICKNYNCCWKQPCLFSCIQSALCVYCKATMGRKMTLPKKKEELFAKKEFKYVISDDLHVQPASMNFTLYLLKKMDIRGSSVLEERHMDLGIHEILALLKRSLASKTTLTDFCYNKDTTAIVASHNLGKREHIQVKTEIGEGTNSKGISIKLLVDEANRRFLCAEAGGNFLNQVFGFLTLPLGSLIKFLDKNSAMGCVDNLYASIENLRSDYIESEVCRSTLLSTKLAPFFGCSNSILKFDESEPRESQRGTGCFYCYWYNRICTHQREQIAFNELNPKSRQGETAPGEGM